MEPIENFSYSSDEDQSENQDPNPPKRSRHDWHELEQFENLGSAKGFIKDQNSWRYNTKTGNCIYYDCKFNRNCESRIKLLLHQDSLATTLLSNQKQHTHNVKDFGLSKEVKNIVIKALADGIDKP